MGMKKGFGVLVALFMCILAIACAQAEQTIQNMPAEQVGVILPDGLAAEEIICTDGMLRVMIDDEATNWARAIAHTGTGAGDAQILWQIKTPAGVQTGDYVIVVSAEDEADALSTLKYCEEYGDYKQIQMIDGWQVACRGDGMPYTERGVGIARSIPEMGYLNPQPYNELVYVGWYTSAADGKMELINNTYQKLHISFTHTRSSAFQTNVFNAAPEERIQANAAGDSRISVLSQKDGSVNYCLPEDGMEVQTAILAPDGAAFYSERANLKSGPASANQPLAENRYAILSAGRYGREYNTSTRTVFFFDEQGGLLEEVSINIGYQAETALKPWPAFSDEMEVVPEERVQIANYAENAGFTVEYDAATGHLQGSYTGKTGNTAPGVLEVKVAAPEDAVSCRIMIVGGNNLLGHDAGSVSGLNYEMDRIYPQGPESISAGYANIESQEIFQKIQPEDDHMTIYIPPMSASIPNHVKLYVYEWYDDWGDQIGATEYLWQTVGNFAIAERLIPVKQQKELTGPVTQPEIVVPNGKPFQGYSLKLTAYTTEATDAWFYDLTLVDANGQAAKPNTPVWVYLPYPEGHQTGTKYKLNHYTDGLYSGDDSGKAETIVIEETLYGLMFETSSFSPFILSVQAEETTPAPTAEPTPAPTVIPTAEPTPTLAPTAEPTPVPTAVPTAAPTAQPTATPTWTPSVQPTAVPPVPQTGDNYPLALLAGIMLTSLCGLVILKKQNRAS